MKNVFGFELENDKGTVRADGERFITERVDGNLKAELDRLSESMEMLDKKAGLPGWARGVKLVAMLTAVLTIGGILKALGKVTVEEAFSNAPYLFLVGGIAAVVWLVLRSIEKSKKKEVDGSDEAAKAKQEAEALVIRSEEALGVPRDYVKVDVLSYLYKVKNGKEKSASVGEKTHSNNELKLFGKDGNLCLADVECLYTVPTECFTKYVLRKKKAVTDSWNKLMPYSKGEYKQYKITANNGLVYFKYISMQFTDTFGAYEITFPEYELKHFMQLVNLPVEKE